MHPQCYWCGCVGGGRPVVHVQYMCNVRMTCCCNGTHVYHDVDLASFV